MQLQNARQTFTFHLSHAGDLGGNAQASLPEREVTANTSVLTVPQEQDQLEAEIEVIAAAALSRVAETKVVEEAAPSLTGGIATCNPAAVPFPLRNVITAHIKPDAEINARTALPVGLTMGESTSTRESILSIIRGEPSCEASDHFMRWLIGPVMLVVACAILVHLTLFVHQGNLMLGGIPLILVTLMMPYGIVLFSRSSLSLKDQNEAIQQESETSTLISHELDVGQHQKKTKKLKKSGRDHTTICSDTSGVIATTQGLGKKNKHFNHFVR